MNRYTRTAVILHWLIAFAIFGMFALGWYMTGLPKEAPGQLSYDLFDLGIYQWELAKEASPRAFYFNLHKSIGITLLGLITLRILWRLANKAPALLTSYKAWERKLSTTAHHTLYLLMLLVPISGLIMSVAGKYGVKWFGLDFIAGIENDVVREIFKETHEIAGLILLAFIALHIAGALKHKLIDKDETMSRMWF